MGHDGAKMGHDSAKMGHDSAKMGHDSAKMGILSSTWEVLGQFWEHFWRILGDGLESEKHLETRKVFSFFLHFWEAQKRCLRHLGSCLGRCWLDECVFSKFFGHVGDKMANKIGKMAT